MLLTKCTRVPVPYNKNLQINRATPLIKSKHTKTLFYSYFIPLIASESN